MRAYLKIMVLTGLTLSFLTSANYSATAQINAASTPENVGVLMAADRAFSQLSEAEGTYVAFSKYLETGAVAMEDGGPFVHGRKNILDRLSMRGAHTMTWEPLGGSLPAGGTLGYTYGRWVLSMNDFEGNPLVRHGKYVTIWRKQLDGSWKVALDGGNSNADPRLNPLQ